MALISYSRSPLLLLRVASSTPEEVLDFLNRYSKHSYEFAPPVGDSSNLIYVRSTHDRSTVLGLMAPMILVHDPDRGGVKFAYNSQSLEWLRLSSKGILRAFAELDAKAQEAS